MQDLFSLAANSVSNFRFPNCSKLRAGYVKRALICFRSIRACRAVVRLLPDEGGCFVRAIKRRNQMANQTTESKRLLSYVIAEWACSLKYENLSLEAIQAAKLFWFDSIGCALTRNLCCRRVLIRPRNPAAAGDWHTPLYEFGV